MQGGCWEDLIEKWELHYKYYPTKKTNSNTVADHAARLRNYTREWFKLPASEISVGDAYELFEKLQRKGLSKSHRTNIKGSISKIFKWGIQRKFILGLDSPPVHGIEIDVYYDEEEEKVPEILTKEEIKLFLLRASQTNHPWFPIWKFDLYSGLRPQELNGLRKPDLVMISPQEAQNKELNLSKDKINYGHINVRRQWDSRSRKCRRVKAKYWRTVPINSILYWWLIEYLPKSNFGEDKHGERVFPEFKDFNSGNQATVIRSLCESQGLKSIKHHTLRACCATQALRSGVPATDLMSMGGWRDYKTMMTYIRLAGMEAIGATQGLNFETRVSREREEQKEKLPPSKTIHGDLPNNILSLFAR